MSIIMMVVRRLQECYYHNKRLIMTLQNLSFDQMREDIFNTIISGLQEDSYSDIQTAVLSGFDPRQLINPRPSDAMLMSQFGTLSIEFKIPNRYPITLNIMLTMGRLSYSLQARRDVCKIARFEETLKMLSAELGLRCDIRHVRDMVRFEFCNEPSLVWANTTLNILKSGQLENAFKEFVILQVERLKIGVSNIIAAHGMIKENPEGFYALCYVKDLYNTDELEAFLGQHFHIMGKDDRDPTAILYGIESKSDLSKAIHICDSLVSALKSKGINAVLRPVWQHDVNRTDEIVRKKTP